MAENDRKTVLDSRMVVAAECLANPAFDGTKEDIARTAGISPSTLYRWLRNPDFVAIVNGLVSQYADAELGMVWKALSRKCQQGDVQAMKLFFELRREKLIQTEKTPEDKIDEYLSALKGALNDGSK